MNQADRYTELYSMEEAPLLKALREETGRKLEYDDMLCGPVVGSLLQLLARMISARTVLEIGTFTGYSALHMAMAIPADG
ncbi:O-methyltransferase, partial [Balneolaceae bacterium ANBcel3]|nr:O-methyltransferase [Balneolaceae bacterium ANBcel3]